MIHIISRSIVVNADLVLISRIPHVLSRLACVASPTISPLSYLALVMEIVEHKLSYIVFKIHDISMDWIVDQSSISDVPSFGYPTSTATKPHLRYAHREVRMARAHPS
ncbi:unnamed protein product [Dovyalis caffra]|uniref:Uncharacterized protein n=1 Tax=Dovyalis caffra TaxID=77055 RepID=A0AAV1SJH6_9ROSI|nr:unnamed protein product [Dovyalis caffra]